MTPSQIEQTTHGSVVSQFNLLAPVFFGDANDEKRQATFQAFERLYTILSHVNDPSAAFHQANIKDVTDIIGEDPVKRPAEFFAEHNYRWGKYVNR